MEETMKKRVLVTGASGYLGGRICHALTSTSQYIVRAFVRETSSLDSLEQAPTLEIAKGDITDLDSLLRASQGCHFIIHTAALVEPWLPDPSLFISVNVTGLKNVIEVLKQTPSVERLIYTSSFFALGPTYGYVADENQTHPKKFFCTEYERSKSIADEIACKAASEGLPIILLYPGVVYGAGKLTSGNFLARLMIERFNGRLPGYLGSGNDLMSFSHVDDVASAHVAAISKGRVGERYLLTGQNASFVTVFDTAAHLTGTSRPYFHVPITLLELYGWLCVFWSKITGKLPLVSYPGIRVLKHQWAYNCEKAKAELDYNPRSLNQGLAEVLFWLKDLGKINF